MLNQFFLGPNNALGPGPMRARGPVVSVEIGIPSVLAQSFSTASQQIPQPQVVNALIDTGASATSVDQQILQSLGLQPVGQTTLATPSHVGTSAGVYAVRLSFPQHPAIPVVADPIHVISCTLANQGIGALLGRDFLSSAILVYNGPGGFYTLAF